MKSQVSLSHLNAEVSIPTTKHVPIAAFLKQQDTDQGRPQEKMRASMEGKKTCLPSSVPSPEAAKDEEATSLCLTYTPAFILLQSSHKVCRPRLYLLLDQYV